jgi:sigma-B regulation protein RsbU (phosphoserine phosphatase)
LSARGIALGVLEEIQLEERTVDLRRGDSLILYTDGVTDAINEKEEDFGMARLLDQARALSGSSATDIVNAVTRAVAHHVGGEAQFDDFTLVVLNRVEGDEELEKTG